jgi:hypothetical protein
MDVFFWVALAWVAINIIAKAVKAAKEKEAERSPHPPTPPAQRLQAQRRVVEYPEPQAGGPASARRFELTEVLRQIERVKRAEEIRRAGEAARGGQELSRIRVSLPPSRQEVEDRQTLETQGDTGEDQDDEIVNLVEQRRREVEAREGEISDAEYASFEQKARQETAARAPHERVRARYTAAQLRSAFIWQEILGPPVSMRDRGFPA